jgi:hypothetical protein
VLWNSTPHLYFCKNFQDFQTNAKPAKPEEDFRDQETRAGFRVLTAASMKMVVFWVVAPCRLARVYRRFRRRCCSQNQSGGPGYKSKDSHLIEAEIIFVKTLTHVPFLEAPPHSAIALDSAIRGVQAPLDFKHSARLKPTFFSMSTNVCSVQLFKKVFEYSRAGFYLTFLYSYVTKGLIKWPYLVLTKHFHVPLTFGRAAYVWSPDH